jgi:hypothetical protein
VPKGDEHEAAAVTNSHQEWSAGNGCRHGVGGSATARRSSRDRGRGVCRARRRGGSARVLVGPPARARSTSRGAVRGRTAANAGVARASRLRRSAEGSRSARNPLGQRRGCDHAAGCQRTRPGRGGGRAHSLVRLRDNEQAARTGPPADPRRRRRCPADPGPAAGAVRHFSQAGCRRTRRAHACCGRSGGSGGRGAAARGNSADQQPAHRSGLV